MTPELWGVIAWGVAMIALAHPFNLFCDFLIRIATTGGNRDDR